MTELYKKAATHDNGDEMLYREKEIDENLKYSPTEKDATYTAAENESEDNSEYPILSYKEIFCYLDDLVKKQKDEDRIRRIAKHNRVEILKHFIIYKSQGVQFKESIELLKNTKKFNDDVSQKFINDFLPNITNNRNIKHEELIEHLSGYDIELAYMEAYFYGKTKAQEVINHLQSKNESSDAKRLLRQILMMKENQYTNREIVTALIAYETNTRNKEVLNKVLDGINNKTFHENGYWNAFKEILPDYIYTMFTRHLDSDMPYSETKRIFELEF